MFAPNNDDKKLDWMYKGASSLIDREEYLLGKCVDKSLEQAQIAEKQAQKGSAQPPKNHVEHECIPPSIRDYKQQIGEQVDLAAKLQEDPLVAIRKREEEARKKFLQNPVQLKKIQKALKEKDKGKKKKSSKKKKKKKKNRSSDDESDDDLDAKLAEKLAQFKNSNMGSEEDNFDAILALKFSVMKNKLSERDYDEVMEGKVDDSDSDEQQNIVESSDDENELHMKVKRKKRRIDTSDSEIERRTNKLNRKMSPPLRKREEFDKKYKMKHRNRSSSEESNSKNERRPKSSKIKRHSRSLDRKISGDRKKYQSEDKPKKKKRQNRSRSREESKSSKKKQKKSSKRSSTDSSDDSSVTETKKNKKRSPSRSPVQKEHIIRKYNSDSDEIVEERRNYGLVNADGSKLTKGTKKSEENRARVVEEKKKEAEKVAYKPEKRKRLTEKEKEKLRNEMVTNAVERCKDREKNLRKYREEDEKEVKERNRDYDPDFMQKQLIKSTSSSTVESRIKSNINNIQRSSQSMNTHFSRK